MVSIISVTAALVLDKGKPGERVRDVRREQAIYRLAFWGTYNRLEGVRGAGMSQRTRRP
jgi:hypothetical protein